MIEEIKKYLNDELQRIDNNRKQLEEIEKIRELQEKEQKYKIQLLGAFFELSTVIYDIENITNKK